MKNNFRILLLILSVTLLAACGKGGKDSGGENPQIPEQALEKFSVMETKEGKPHWVLDAASAQILETQKKVLLKSPQVQFYQEGKLVSTLIAATGRINTENYDIWGEGDCVLTTVEGERLETQNLHYRSDIKKIVTDEKVKLIRPHEIITGTGMEATPDLENITIKKQRVEVKGS